MGEKTPANLLAEAVATYNEIDRRCRLWASYMPMGRELAELHVREYKRLRRARERAWNRYLRRWVNQDEVEWFEPWLSKKVSK